MGERDNRRPANRTRDGLEPPYRRHRPLFSHKRAGREGDGTGRVRGLSVTGITVGVWYTRHEMTKKPDPTNKPDVSSPRPGSKGAAKRRGRRPTVKESAERVVRAFEQTFRELGKH